MRRQFILLLAILAVASCSKAKPDDKVVGSWSGDPPIAKQFANDPNMRGFMDFMKDSVQIELRSDHTYTLLCWARKTGTWKLSQRLVSFQETNSQTDLPFMVDGMEFGTVDHAGNRTYSAILAPDGKSLTLLMGKLGDVTFHR